MSSIIGFLLLVIVVLWGGLWAREQGVFETEFRPQAASTTPVSSTSPLTSRATVDDDASDIPNAEIDDLEIPLVTDILVPEPTADEERPASTRLSVLWWGVIVGVVAVLVLAVAGGLWWWQQKTDIE